MESNQEMDKVFGPSVVEPKEGDKAGNVEYINPASEAGQAYIDEVTTNQPGVDGNYDKTAKEYLDKELLEDNRHYEEPADEAHQELACAMEGPCEVSAMRMFSTLEEDIEDKFNKFYLDRVQREIATGQLFTREQVRREIDAALEKQMEDLKYNMGAQLLERMLGNPKSKVISQERIQEANETMELLEEGIPITSPEEIESYPHSNF